MREERNGNSIKIITVILVGASLIAGAVASAYKIADDAKTYTDSNIRYLRDEQTQKLDKIQDDVGQMKETLSRVETIIEGRLLPKSPYSNQGRGETWPQP